MQLGDSGASKFAFGRISRQAASRLSELEPREAEGLAWGGGRERRLRLREVMGLTLRCTAKEDELAPEAWNSSGVVTFCWIFWSHFFLISISTAPFLATEESSIDSCKIPGGIFLKFWHKITWWIWENCFSCSYLHTEWRIQHMPNEFFWISNRIPLTLTSRK